ncbi:MAG: ferrochelatase [Rhodospirillaceae bacterium]|mgnify:CR=1 FL=1|nr:ferrochelatase [Rhodospirillaceae bacterium]
MAEAVKTGRTAVVLFNLGGPDSPQAVRPFLFNLFNDRAIIDLPNPLRFFLAKLISGRREKTAQAIYDHLGGRSPLLDLTKEQAAALEGALADLGEVKVFVAMRYWHPFSVETAADVKRFSPDRVVLLPLYPQFSGTTTGSSFKDWDQAARKVGLTVSGPRLCCYPQLSELCQAHAALIAEHLEEARQYGKFRVLFSAHGLPKKIIAKGDPYQWQVERCVEGVVSALGDRSLDWSICYQSRVGPLEWIGPSTDEEIRRAGAEGVALVVVPIAFVSEHSETLVEIGIEYRHLAESVGVPGFVRVPALNAADVFIRGLAGMVRESADQSGVCPAGRKGTRICPKEFGRCPADLPAETAV